jgi:hypothetical protein
LSFPPPSNIPVGRGRKYLPQDFFQITIRRSDGRYIKIFKPYIEYIQALDHQTISLKGSMQEKNHVVIDLSQTFVFKISQIQDNPHG